MDTLGIEPRASRMLSGCDTTTPRALRRIDSSRGSRFFTYTLRSHSVFEGVSAVELAPRQANERGRTSEAVTPSLWLKRKSSGVCTHTRVQPPRSATWPQSPHWGLNPGPSVYKTPTVGVLLPTSFLSASAAPKNAWPKQVSLPTALADDVCFSLWPSSL